METQLIIAYLLLQRPIYQPIMSVNDTCAAKCDQNDLFLLARLEAYCRSGCDVQAHPVSGRAIKFQAAIDLKEVIVATDLYWPITRIFDQNRCRFASVIGDNLAFVQQIF